MRDGKRLVRVETGVWIDPEHVVAIHPIAVGIRGFVKIMLDTGEHVQCCEHEAIVAGKADPDAVEQVMTEIVESMTHLAR